MNHPFGSFHEQSTALETRKRQEKSRLRNDAAYIGALSLALTIVTEYAFSFIVIFLVKCGVFPVENVSKPFLGLDNTTYMCIYIAVYTLSLLIPAVIVSLCFKKRFFPFSPSKSVPFGAAFLSLLGAIGLCMLSNVINSLVSVFFSEAGLSVPEAPQTMVQTPTSLAMNLFTLAVLPALLEEMIYRGYILRTLRPYGNFFAVFFSSLLFSLMHGNLRQIPFAFFVGIVLGLLYVSTNNIWLPVSVHLANNAISVLMEYFSFSLSEEYVGVFYALIIYGLIFVGIIATILLLAFYGKKLKINRAATSLSGFTRIGTLLTTPLFLTAMLMYSLLLFMEI